MNRPESPTDDMTELDEFEVSNFDHSVPSGAEAALRARPDGAYIDHAAWNFHGRIWFDGTRFCEEVRRNCKVVNVLCGDTLEEVIQSANDEYGDD